MRPHGVGLGYATVFPEALIVITADRVVQRLTLQARKSIGMLMFGGGRTREFAEL